jgi:hypothetical protein
MKKKKTEQTMTDGGCEKLKKKSIKTKNEKCPTMAHTAGMSSNRNMSERNVIMLSGSDVCCRVGVCSDSRNNERLALVVVTADYRTGA